MLLKYLLPLLLFAPLPAIAVPATVVSVGDGDTFRASQSGKNVTVRLGCVDAPERRQNPYGSQSSNRLKALLPIGSTVDLRKINVDRYGRTVAEVTAGSTLVNLQLVQEGLAVVYHEYLGGCPQNRARYLQAEQRARQQRLGLWSKSPVCLPKDFRRKKCA